jgi:hypothetical protein
MQEGFNGLRLVESIGLVFQPPHRSSLAPIWDMEVIVLQKALRNSSLLIMWNGSLLRLW